MAVYVLDKKQKPLMPCSEKRARLLLTRKKAVVHRVYPFAIRMLDRTREESILQPVCCKIDPGSVKTGIALSRKKEKIQTVISLLELNHRGALIRKQLLQRRGLRRRRRSNLRYRSPRFDNRCRKSDWLAPSLAHRVENILHWVERLQRLVPITSLACEVVRFDTQKLINPEIQGTLYNQGTLFGYEIREYLLEKWERKCAYCGQAGTPLEIDHIIPRSRGGSNRVDNLTIACCECNRRKGNLSLEVFAPSCVEKIRKVPSFADSAAVNSTRVKLSEKLEKILPCEKGTGGQTKYNRSHMQIPKTHALDAACVGEVDLVYNWNIPTQKIASMGRGSYKRTRSNQYGFPRGILSREKQVFGFQTGDRVKATVPQGKKEGEYIGRLAIRSSGYFNIQTDQETIQGISWKHCRLIQRADGYHYNGLLPVVALETNKRRALPPRPKERGVRVLIR
jgi:5-methylcytosine-specific restriction endonuclease McrA